MKRLIPLILPLILLLAHVIPASAQTVGTWTLTEQFGTNWPNQPIEFPTTLASDPGTTVQLFLAINGGSPAEVDFQWEPESANGQVICYGHPAARDATVKGCIITYSPLNAGDVRVFTLSTGTKTASPPSNPAALATVGNNFEVTNGLTGARIVTAAANTTPFRQAPLQGIQLISGTWTGAGASPNLIYTGTLGGQCVLENQLTVPATTANGYTVTTVVSGPLKTVLQATTTFARPAYTCTGFGTINPAGAGHYTATYTVWAGISTVGIDEDSDMQMQYFVPTLAEVAADTERHRGANSFSQQQQPAGNDFRQGDPICGYGPAIGVVTGATNAMPVVITLSVSNIALNGAYAQIAGIGGTVADGFYYLALVTPTTYGLYSDANLTIPVAGLGTYTSGGTVKPAYLGNSGYPTPDALMDLTYSHDRPNSTVCSNGFASTWGWTQMPSNYPTNSKGGGWYETLYNSTGGGSSDTIGLYQGQVGLLVGVGTSGSNPGIYTSNSHFVTSAIAGGIQVYTTTQPIGGRNPPIAFHRNWGIYVDTLANIGSPTAGVEPIGSVQNMLTGINLSDLYTYDLVFPDPVGGWTPLYLTPTGFNTLVSLVQDGTPACGSSICYYNLLNNGDGSTLGTALLNMWRTNSTAGITTALNTLLGTGINSFASFSNSLVTSDNHWAAPYAYYQVGLNLTSQSVTILNAILLNSNSTTAQKNLAKAMLAFAGNTLVDPNWWNPNTGEGTGNGNQNSQYVEYQTQIIATIPSQPYLSTFLSQGITNTQGGFTSSWSNTGAVIGSMHYQSTFTEPTGENYLGLTLTGHLDFSDPTWQAYGKLELSGLTPPEVRYGGTTGSSGLGFPMRKMLSFGDGNTESLGAVRQGIMANALQTAAPALAANLQWGFNSSNSWIGSGPLGSGGSQITGDHTFLSTFSVIDPTITPVAPVLASLNVPGYWSSERFNFGTANETAVWFINGGYVNQNSGHRHADDGQTSIYALGAPLSIDFNADVNAPLTPARFMHNSMILDAALTAGGQTWNQDSPSVSTPEVVYSNQTNTEFVSVTASTGSCATFTLDTGPTTWSRCVRTMNFNPAYPVIYVKDTFAGTNAAAGKTITWNMMAGGNVTTPAGAVTPIIRNSSWLAGCSNTPGVLPSNGTVNNLSAGLNSFHFSGQGWVAHPSGGVDWDLFLDTGSGTSQQFLIGNWGHECNNNRETTEYENSQAVTVSSYVSPNINFTGANPYFVGQRIVATSGTPPAGLTGDLYVVTSASNSVQVSATAGGSPITWSGGGSGTTLIKAIMNESQDMLRVHDPGTSGGTFGTTILPYAKGATPTRTVTSAGLGTRIVHGTQTTEWNDSAATFTDTATGVSNLTMYDSSSLTALGMTAAGGTQEAVLTTSPSQSIVWTISGAAAGSRSFTPPAGSWMSSPAITPVGGVFTVAYTGGLQAAPLQFTLTAGSSGNAVATAIGGGRGVGNGSSIP